MVRGTAGMYGPIYFRYGGLYKVKKGVVEKRGWNLTGMVALKSDSW